MKKAKVKTISFDRALEIVTIEINVEDTIFVSKPGNKTLGSTMLMNSAILEGGINMLCEQELEGLDALRGVRQERKDMINLLQRIDSLLTNLQNEGRNLTKTRHAVLEMILKLDPESESNQ